MAKRWLALLTVVMVALAAPAAAPGKGWMVVSAPPDGVEAEQTWDATLTFPLANHPGAPPVPRKPEIVFTHLASNLRLRFLAVPTRRRGVLRARVTLPKAGVWTVYVWAYEMGAVAPAPSSRESVVRPPRRRQARNVAAVTHPRPTSSATVPAMRSGR